MRNRRRIWPSFATSRTSPSNSFARRWRADQRAQAGRVEEVDLVQVDDQAVVAAFGGADERRAHRRRRRDVERTGQLEDVRAVDHVHVDREVFVMWCCVRSVDVHQPSYSRQSAISPRRRNGRWRTRAFAFRLARAFGRREAIDDAGAARPARSRRRPRSATRGPPRRSARSARRSRRGREAARLRASLVRRVGGETAPTRLGRAHPRANASEHARRARATQRGDVRRSGGACLPPRRVAARRDMLGRLDSNQRMGDSKPLPYRLATPHRARERLSRAGALP